MASLYSLTAFVGAFLLFAVQPMVGKMLLPRLGGVPAVWTTCMLFFQAALLVGYGCAHAMTRALGVRAAIFHALLVAAAFAALPLSIDIGVGAGSAPVYALLRGLLVGVGLPFLALSATAPLLQRAYADTTAQDADDPYFLYAASNVGSLVALAAYPLWIEPRLDLDQQQRGWSAGYAALAILLWIAAAAGARARRRRGPTLPEATIVDLANTSRRSQPLRQVLLAFVPSVLLLGVTTHLTTDVAAMPLLWVAPLSIYLVTFILAFARRQRLTIRRAGQWFAPLAVASILLITVRVPALQYATMALLMVTLFFGATLCHLALAQSRPAPVGLTGYFARVGLGGALGGAFCTLIAPRLFDSISELPLAIVLVLLVNAYPAEPGGWRRAGRDWIAAPIAALLMGIGALAGDALGQAGQLRALILVFGLPAALAWSVRRQPLAFAAAVAGMAIGLSQYSEYASSDVRFAERGFFGTVRVVDDGGYRLMVHGSTIHGAERIGDDDRPPPANLDAVPEPLTYFDRAGPLGQVFALLHERVSAPEVLVAGLGVGAVAAYATVQGSMTFLEIDPTVARIAQDPQWFHFLSRAEGQVAVRLGDARMLIAADAERRYDLILLDAFGSDSIPAHLVTREALALYLDRLTPDGLLVFNLTNRFVDLLPMIARLADEQGLVARVRSRPGVTEEERARLLLPCRFLTLARTTEDLGRIAFDPRWIQPVAGQSVRVWTDRYSSLVPALRW